MRRKDIRINRTDIVVSDYPQSSACFQQPLGAWFGSERNVAEFGYHLTQIEPSVEAITIFSEIAREMVLSDSMETSMDRAFHVTDNRVDPFEFREFNTLRTASGDNGCMVKSSFLKSLETIQTIRDNLTCLK